MLEVKAELERSGKFFRMHEIAKLAGPRWDQLSHPEKEHYKQMARVEKSSAQATSSIEWSFAQASSSSSCQEMRHDGSCGKKKRRNGFFMFMQAIKRELEDEIGTYLLMDEVAELAGPRWCQLSSEEKEQYKAQAKTEI